MKLLIRIDGNFPRIVYVDRKAEIAPAVQRICRDIIQGHDFTVLHLDKEFNEYVELKYADVQHLDELRLALHKNEGKNPSEVSAYMQIYSNDDISQEQSTICRSGYEPEPLPTFTGSMSNYERFAPRYDITDDGDSSSSSSMSGPLSDFSDIHKTPVDDIKELPWPGLAYSFTLPEDLEWELKRYENPGAGEVPKGLKRQIAHALFVDVRRYTGLYITGNEYQIAGAALVRNYPVLKDEDSDTNTQCHKSWSERLGRKFREWRRRSSHPRITEKRKKHGQFGFGKRPRLSNEIAGNCKTEA